MGVIRTRDCLCPKQILKIHKSTVQSSQDFYCLSNLVHANPSAAKSSAHSSNPGNQQYRPPRFYRTRPAPNLILTCTSFSVAPCNPHPFHPAIWVLEGENPKAAAQRTWAVTIWATATE